MLFEIADLTNYPCVIQNNMKKNTIVSIDNLKPLEKVFMHHLKNLSEMILKKGVVQTPIIVKKKHGIILDGSHRYIFF